MVFYKAKKIDLIDPVRVKYAAGTVIRVVPSVHAIEAYVPSHPQVAMIRS